MYFSYEPLEDGLANTITHVSIISNWTMKGTRAPDACLAKPVFSFSWIAGFDPNVYHIKAY